MPYIPLGSFIDGLRQTADFLNDAVFSDDIAAMRDALELGRNNLRGAADKLSEVAGNYEEVVRRLAKKVVKLERERNAALTDLWSMASCKRCKHEGSRATDDSKCGDCRLGVVPGHPELTHRTNWEWRGPCAENGGESLDNKG